MQPTNRLKSLKCNKLRCRYLLCCVPRRIRRRRRCSSDLSSRGRGQSFSLISSKRYDSRRGQRNTMHMSIFGNDTRTSGPIKEQETTISLTACPNGIEDGLKSQQNSTTEQSNIRECSLNSKDWIIQRFCSNQWSRPCVFFSFGKHYSCRWSNNS